MPVPWSPANRAQFPKCSRRRAASLGFRLLRDGAWVAKRSRRVPESDTKDNCQIVRDEWFAFVPTLVSELVPPMSRVVAGGALPS